MSVILGTNKKRIGVIAGLLVLSAIGASWNLPARSLDDHECFVTVTAREMLANGNWVMPTYNGQPRLQKTPLSYWLVAGLAKITGRVDELTARLPSAIFAVLSVAAMIYFVAQFLSFRTALTCAAIWATSLGYIRYAHNARPDMALTFFVMVCYLSFYTALIAQSRKRQVIYMVIFWVCFGLANLAKGPVPIPLVLVPLFFYITIFRQWRELPKMLPVTGILIFLAIMLPWPVIIAYKVNWDVVIWKREFIDRFFGEYAKGDYPVYYYFLIMFKYIVPWAAFLPVALIAPFYRAWGSKKRIMQFFWMIFVVDFAFLTLSGGKRQQYIMPIMPAIIILTGILLEDMVFVRRAFTNRFAVNFLRVHIVVIVVAAAVVPVIIFIAGARWYIYANNPQLLAAAITLSAAAVILTVVIAVLFVLKKPALGITAIFLAIIICAAISYSKISPLLDPNRYMRDFSLKVAGIVPQSDKIAAGERMPARCLHYFGRGIPAIKDKTELYKNYQEGFWVIATGKQLRELTVDGRFRRVYYDAKADYYRGQWTAGGLFSKSAPIVGKNE
jgi:4-amino-4-deoxy-L-arabinose transferase-like glycosyltransferase